MAEACMKDSLRSRFHVKAWPANPDHSRGPFLAWSRGPHRSAYRSDSGVHLPSRFTLGMCIQPPMRCFAALYEWYGSYTSTSIHQHSPRLDRHAAYR